MQPKLTRQQRRRMRRHADAMAEYMAATTKHRDNTGRVRPVDRPAARALLRQGFAALIRNDCRPVVQRLTEAQARDLPGWHPTPPGASWWIAYGLDVDLCATWVMRWSLAYGPLPEAEAADATEVILLEALAAVCNQPGLGEVAR